MRSYFVQVQLPYIVLILQMGKIKGRPPGHDEHFLPEVITYGIEHAELLNNKLLYGSSSANVINYWTFGYYIPKLYTNEQPNSPTPFRDWLGNFLPSVKH